MQKPVVIVIGGPTASGKTAAAIEVAKKLGTEIINADSRQLYKELSIGVAKPNQTELDAVKHHCISAVSIKEHFSAGDFADLAHPILQNILSKNGFVVISGGTGLYIQSLLQGFDELPNVTPEIREQVDSIYAQDGLEGTKNALLKHDPHAPESVEMSNPARVKRALELVLTSQKSLKELYQGKVQENDFLVLGYYLQLPRNLLYERINQRVDEMLAAGLESEARDFLSQKHLKALQTVGYNEFFEYFEGHFDLQTCIEKIKQHTRNYAKRQITWFKNRTNYKPVSPENLLHTIFADLKLHGYSVHE